MDEVHASQDSCCCRKIVKVETTLAEKHHELEQAMNSKHEEVLSTMSQAMKYQKELFQAAISAIEKSTKGEDRHLTDYLVQVAKVTLDNFTPKQ